MRLSLRLILPDRVMLHYKIKENHVTDKPNVGSMLANRLQRLLLLSKHEAFTLFCLDVAPASKTVDQH